jgi:serine/threonine protein kinase
MWADRSIGTAAMEAARETSTRFYNTLYNKQAQRRLARDEVTDPEPAGPNGTAVFSGLKPAATDSGAAGSNGAAVFSGLKPAATDPGTGSGDKGRRQDNLEDESYPFNHTELAVGATLEGGFRLVKPLGQRGIHYAVYRVRKLSVNGRDPVDDGGSVGLVAKIAVDGDGGYGYEGLEREVQVGQGAEHEHIVPALSRVRWDDRLKVAYRIMPYYPGGHLGNWIENHPRRTLADMLDVGDGILAGLVEGHVHRHFTHWDIKPENVLMRDAGENPHPVIGDWGNGRALFQFSGQSTFEQRGTPDYCAPEQVTRTRERDRRCYASDLYSWAAVMFYFVEEISPRRYTAVRAGVDVANSLQYQDFIRSNLVMPKLAGRTPPELAELIHRWLAFEPEDRFLNDGTRLTDDELRRRQVVSDVRQELDHIRINLSPEQLAIQVRLMTGGGDDGHTPAGQRTAQW